MKSKEEFYELTKQLDVLAELINAKSREQDNREGETFSNSRCLSRIYEDLGSLEYATQNPKFNHTYNIHDGCKKNEIDAASIILELLDFCYQNQIRIGKAVEALYYHNEKSNTH